MSLGGLLAGLHGIYQGLTATIIKQASNQAIRFSMMTSLRNWYRGNSCNPLGTATVNLGKQPGEGKRT